MEENRIIRFASRMDQLPPYLFGMINKMKMDKRRSGDDVIDLGMGNPMDPTPKELDGTLKSQEPVCLSGQKSQSHSTKWVPCSLPLK